MESFIFCLFGPWAAFYLVHSKTNRSHLCYCWFRQQTFIESQRQCSMSMSMLILAERGDGRCRIPGSRVADGRRRRISSATPGGLSLATGDRRHAAVGALVGEGFVRNSYVLLLKDLEARHQGCTPRSFLQTISSGLSVALRESSVVRAI